MDTWVLWEYEGDGPRERVATLDAADRARRLGSTRAEQAGCSGGEWAQIEDGLWQLRTPCGIYEVRRELIQS